MNENVNVCITPKGDKPILHFSQFDNERVFTVTVLADDGESAAVLTGLDIELRLRKTDSHVVTIAPESVADNVITFKTTEQLCACCGQNIASVVLMDNEMIVSTLDILVDIQRDILSGGLTSESDIRNLTTQIEQIVPEVIGDDYYTKTEVDDLLAEHTFDPTNYYDKSDVDGLLADKADADDVYTKTETDNLLADKADKSDTYTKTDVDNLLMDRMGNIEFTALTPGTYPVISFNSSYNAPIIDIEAEITSSASTINLIRNGANFFDKKTFSDWNIVGNYAINNAVLPKNTRLKLVFFDNDTTVSVAGCYFGYIQEGYSGGEPATNSFRWVLSNGSIFPEKRNIPANGDSSIYLTNLMIFPNTAETYNKIFSRYNVMLVLESDNPTVYESYKGQIKTITLDSPVSSGSIDFARGTVTDSGNVITFTPVTVDALVGVNNIFIDVGNMTSLTYVSQADLGLMALLEAYTLR